MKRRIETCCLKREFQAGLEHTRSTPAPRSDHTGDQTRRGTVELVIRQQKIRAVQRIVRLDAYLHALPFLNAEVLHHRRIDVGYAGSIQDAAPRVAVHKRLEPVLIRGTA